MIDAHIHLDDYQDKEIDQIMEDSAAVEGLITVSSHLESCRRNLQLAEKYKKVAPAFGFHPEQPIPSHEEQKELLSWMEQHRKGMAAIGEVGLPYYLRQEKKISREEYKGYIELLEAFVQLAKRWSLPIVLHAVYDDAPIVCEMLEKYGVSKAHFHWFKGDEKTIKRMISNGYLISVTPDVVYETEIQQLVSLYPIENMMIETDGPWPFEGTFSGKRTNPNMMAESVKAIAKIKGMPAESVAERLLENTKNFYSLHMKK